MGVASCPRPRPGSGRDIEPRRGLLASQSVCGRGRSWLCSLLKMAAQPPTGIRLSAVSSREGRSGPGPRRAGGWTSQGGGSGRRRLEGMARRPGGRVGSERPPPCPSARRSGCDVRFVRSRRLGPCRGSSPPQAASLSPALLPPTAVVGAAPSATRPPREQPPGLPRAAWAAVQRGSRTRRSLSAPARRRGVQDPLLLLGMPLPLLRAESNSDKPV